MDCLATARSFTRARRPRPRRAPLARPRSRRQQGLRAQRRGRAAVQVETKLGDKTQKTYGVIWITADTDIDKETHLVELENIQIKKANFPTAREKTEQYLEVFRSNVERTRTTSLDRVEASLAITQADRKGSAVPLKNDPPKIYYRTRPALLVLIDGEPAQRPVEGVSGVERVVNTRGLILKTGGAFYMPITDKWVRSGAATGPPASVASVLAILEMLETQPELRARLWVVTERMRAGYRAMGYDTGPSQTPIIPIVVHDDEKCFMLWRLLREEGIFTTPVVSPAVPPGHALVRTSYGAGHTDEELDAILKAFEKSGKALGII